jgi:hypothetical protein
MIVTRGQLLSARFPFDLVYFLYPTTSAGRAVQQGSGSTAAQPTLCQLTLLLSKLCRYPSTGGYDGSGACLGQAATGSRVWPQVCQP